MQTSNDERCRCGLLRSQHNAEGEVWDYADGSKTKVALCSRFAPASAERDPLGMARGAERGATTLTDPPGCVTPASCSIAEPRCRHCTPTPAAMLEEALGHITKARAIIASACSAGDVVAERADDDLDEAATRIGGLLREKTGRSGDAWERSR